MPIYEFGCPNCKEKIERFLPRSEYNSHPGCPECRSPMNRFFSVPHRAIAAATGRDKVLASLNAKDDGIGNKPHIKNALWKGLNQRDPVVGRGFG